MAIVQLKIGLNEKNRLAVNSSDFRKRAAEEAISWKRGTIENKFEIPMYSGRRYGVVLRKPGKESPADYARCTYKDGRKGNNPNDMAPTLILDGVQSSIKFGFDDIFEIIHSIQNQRSLEIMGAIIVRMAFMKGYAVDSQGHIRLRLSSDAISYLEAHHPLVKGIPIKAFIEMIEIISLNEDVKYHTLGYNHHFKNGAGKRNNLLTYARLIAVLLNRESFYAFAGSFARPPVGISTISKSKAFEVFPDLN